MQPKSAEALPEYDKPPVVEVVCGVKFETLEPFSLPHFGLLWQQFRAEYPEFKQVAPLVIPVEGEGGSEVEFAVPPLPRLWFISADQNALIQVQRDYFLHNWKKVRDTDDYPRYSAVLQMFKQRLATFEAFLVEQALPAINPLQYEMTYVNHLARGEGWNNPRDLGGVFPELSWRNVSGRFLAEPEGVHYRTSFQLPHKAGRLHVAIRSAQRLSDQQPIVAFELTARGIGQDRSREAMWQWLDMAREWIVRAFADLTSEHVQKDLWRRR